MHHYNIWMQILFILTLPAWIPNTASSKNSGNGCCKIKKKNPEPRYNNKSSAILGVNLDTSMNDYS
jgi:hypothetical protein